jgi:hypothetical protein
LRVFRPSEQRPRHNKITMKQAHIGSPRLLAVVLATAGFLACSSAPRIKELPPQTVTQVKPPPESPADFDDTESSQVDEGDQVATFEPAAEPASQETDDPTLIVINPDEASDEEVSLWEASQAERRRRMSAPPPIAVITDKNLAEFAEGGQLTLVDKPIAPSTSASELVGSQEEQEWRRRARKIRSDWRQTVEEIEKLKAEADRLRTRFYEEEDAYVRDHRIKPSWDRVLDRLSELRTREGEFEAELEAFMEEGRRAGALAGWLREGIELEPKREAEEEIPEHDFQEPQIVGEDNPR